MLPGSPNFSSRKIDAFWGWGVFLQIKGRDGLQIKEIKYLNFARVHEFL